MAHVSKTLCFSIFLAVLTLVAVNFSAKADAEVFNSASSPENFVLATDALVLSQELLASETALGSIQTIADRRGDNRHDGRRVNHPPDRRDNDRFDDRRDDKRYPKCRRINNHDTKRYRECVMKNYYSHNNRRDNDRRDVDHRDNNRRDNDRRDFDRRDDNRRDDKRHDNYRGDDRRGDNRGGNFRVTNPIDKDDNRRYPACANVDDHASSAYKQCVNKTYYDNTMTGAYSRTYSKTYPVCVGISDIDKFKKCVDEEYYDTSKNPLFR
jgi:hypothetical protein